MNDLSNKVCIPNKTEDLNLSMFNMITEINESKKLPKHLSCECKKYHKCERDYVWNPGTCSCENRKYLGSIMHDSIIICDKFIEWYEEKNKNHSNKF